MNETYNFSMIFGKNNSKNLRKIIFFKYIKASNKENGAKVSTPIAAAALWNNDFNKSSKSIPISWKINIFFREK